MNIATSLVPRPSNPSVVACSTNMGEVSILQATMLGLEGLGMRLHVHCNYKVYIKIMTTYAWEQSQILMSAAEVLPVQTRDYSCN